MPIVSAVGVGFSVGMDAARMAKLSVACEAAIKHCQAAGITDPDMIRAAILAARDAVLATD